MVIIIISLILQGCSSSPRLAMDYLPDSTKYLIDNDISRQQSDEEWSETSSISVRSMLDSILEKEPILKPKGKAASVATHYIEPNFMQKPQKKPIIGAARKTPNNSVGKIILVINIALDENTLDKIQNDTREFSTENTAVLIIGPVSQAENLELASLQALSKASYIGLEIQAQFSDVHIRFDPLLPRETIRIIIRSSSKKVENHA